MRSLVNLVVLMALATQVSHAAWLFNDIGKPDDGTLPWMGWVFALSLETSIFVFTVYGKKGVATFFAVVSTLVNLLYYWIEVSLSHRFFAMLVISPIIPTTIWYYSDLVNELRRRQEEEDAPIGGYYAGPPSEPAPPVREAPVADPTPPKAQEAPVVAKPKPNGNSKPKPQIVTRESGEDWEILDDDRPDWRESGRVSPK